jgi:outer membrane protein assembly factor BamB
MDQESKIKFTKQLMQVSGAFCLLVAILLLFNFWQMKTHEPLESETIEALVKRLSDEPRNEELKQEIRSFDLMARKAYFTSAWQVKTGAYLLFFGAMVFAIALKINSDLKRRIERPEDPEADTLKTKLISHRWLLITGIMVFVLALSSAFLSKDYLADYFPEQTQLAEISDSSDDIEIIEIVDSTTIIEEDPGDSIQVADNEDPVDVPAEEIKAVEVVKTTEKAVSREDFKKYQSSFRGYLGQGISFHKNIPTDWDGPSGKNIKWKVALEKPGFNSPVIWGDKIFVASGDSEYRLVSCFDKNSGRLLWEHKADNIEGSPSVPPKTTDDTGLAAPTMTTDGYRVFAIFGTGDIIAFDLDGKRVWAKNLGVPVNHYGHSSSLIVWNDKLFVQYDTSKGGRMLALDTKTGNVVWDIKRNNMISWSSPMLYEKDGKMQIVTTADPSVAGYDLETGKELWRTEVLMGEVAPSAATWNGIIYASNEYAITIAIKPGPQGVETVWETDEYLSEVSSPVASEGLLFLATSYGVLVCYDALTGENVWEKQFDEGIYSSPMVAEGKLYIIDMGGVMHVFKVDRTGTLINEPKLGEAAFAVPVFEDGRIYLRGKNSLFCIEQ